MAPYCCGVAGLMGLDRARESSMQPGRELNPFAHKPQPSARVPPHPRLIPRSQHPPSSPQHANTNENTNRPSVISLFTAPTVITGHGDGSLVHDQGSSDTPLTPLPKINTRQLLVLSTVLLGGT